MSFFIAAPHHSRFRVQSLTAATIPKVNTAIAHLRDVLGDPAYGSLARRGEAMTSSAMVT
jgi:hypothetical protein